MREWFCLGKVSGDLVHGLREGTRARDARYGYQNALRGGRLLVFVFEKVREVLHQTLQAILTPDLVSQSVHLFLHDSVELLSWDCCADV